MELKERIAEALRIAGKSPTQVAAETGVSDSAISQLLSGKTKTLRASTAVKLEAATGVRTSWLVSGDGPQLAAPMAIHHMAGSSDTDEGVRVELLANSASMGAGSDLEDEDVLSGHITLTPAFVRDHIRPSRLDRLKFIHAYGDSMAPTLNSGDVLLVDTGVTDVKIDGIYVLRAHERLFVKRVRQRLDGRYEISSDNPTHKTVDILNGDHEVSVAGRVLWAWNGRKM